MVNFRVTGPPSPSAESNQNPYRGPVLVLLASAFLGTGGALVAGLLLANPVVLDAAVSLGLATGVLIDVLESQIARAKPPKSDAGPPIPVPAEKPEAPAETPASTEPETPASPEADGRKQSLLQRVGAAWHWLWLHNLGTKEIVRIGTATAGFAVIAILLLFHFAPTPMAPLMAGTVAALFLGASGLAATAAHYLAGIDSAWLPEAQSLCRGARVLAWILASAAVSIGIEWAGQNTVLQILHIPVLAINAAVCYSLLRAKPPGNDGRPGIIPLDIGVLSMLGSRANILGSILDAGERQLGIDLRSTWALTIVRRSLEPLVIGLCLLGWLSTCISVVRVQEVGLVERLGVPFEGQPLEPGLHLHWPWPVDQVIRIPVKIVQTLQVGHEGQESEGPENVLWAVEHAPNEYTLLLGNGRDLITVDATVQYLIADARAWRYHCQNPAAALRAIAYRAVMISTVNRTLSEALSENVATLTGQMRARVQKDADALGLGVQVLTFTVGGMHPPVPVAADYEAVVSAQLGSVTAIVNAQAYRNRTVPTAEALVVVSENEARAEGVRALALAAGQAWSFRTLESQYRIAPEEFFFRRRLETLENSLGGLRFTVVDARFQRDGGEIWLTQ